LDGERWGSFSPSTGTLLANDLDQLVRQLVRLHGAGRSLDFHVVRIGHRAAVMMRSWR